MAHYIFLVRIGEKGMKCECKLPPPFFVFGPILASLLDSEIWGYDGEWMPLRIVTYAIIDPISFSSLSFCVIN
jgi:hypothetical protein